MAINFTAEDRLNITRRQLNIADENAGFVSTKSVLTTEQQKLLKVDQANSLFYNQLKTQVNAYELEARYMNGIQSDFYTEGTVSPYLAGHMVTSAKKPGSSDALNIFYPAAYPGMIPKVHIKNNGYLNTIGSDALYELNILSGYDKLQSVSNAINLLVSGDAGAGSTTFSTAVPAGNLVSHTISVLALVGAIGDYIFLNQGASSGCYKILNQNTIGSTPPYTYTMTITSVYPSLIGFSSGTIQSGFAGFTNSQRETMVHGTYQEFLVNLTNHIKDWIQNQWLLKITDTITQLDLNDDNRSPQNTQNIISRADAANCQTIINNWLALPDTGVSGKFVNASISNITSEISARQSFISTRIPEIVTALGSVSQTGDETFSGTGVYYLKYKWLNIRIGRMSGSISRYFGAEESKNRLQSMINDNNSVKGEYDSYFMTKKITTPIDLSGAISLSSTTGLSVNQIITVVSETKPEIQRKIVKVLGKTQVTLDNLIPKNYTLEDKARIFIQL